LPRVGARTLASAIASFGGLRAGPLGSGAGTCSSLIGRHRRGGVGCPTHAASRRQARDWSRRGCRGARRGSPARLRTRPRGRRDRRSIPRCRNRTGICPG